MPPRPAIEQFTPNLPFHLETAGRGIGEMQHLDHAFNTGMVSAFIGANRGPLYLTIRGRERSGDFDFSIAGQPVHVSGVQVEVDGGYEGPRDILLAEAKIGVPTSFNIRQLFYPYRRFSSLVPTKRVRPLFFAYDFSHAAYSFYEFEFRDPNDLNSLALVQSKQYALPPLSRLKIEALEDVRYESPGSEGRLAPQADDLNKIMPLLMAIDEGYTSSDDLALYFNFDPRQSNYYAEAAEYLDLVDRGRGAVSLTPRGLEFIQTTLDDKPVFIARMIVNSWIFRQLTGLARGIGHFTIADIDRVLSDARDEQGAPGYGGTTIPRRRQTVVAWLKRLAEQIGCYNWDPRNPIVFTLK